MRELTTPEQRRAVPPGAGAVISDRGDSIAVAITRDGKTTVRVYRDAARDCARRGHFVSVLVVVSLMPPDLGSDPEAAESTPTAPRDATLGTETSAEGGGGGGSLSESEREPSRTLEQEQLEEPAATSSRKRIWIELGARAEASTPLSDSVRVAAWGAALGAALGAGKLRLTLHGSYLPRSELRYTGRFAGSAELERMDLAVGVRLALGRTPVDTSFDAGLVLSRSIVSGRDSLRPARDTALTPGLRAGFHLSLDEQSRLSPFLGASAQIFPSAPALVELPQGTVGHLPYVWVGLSGGLALAL